MYTSSTDLRAPVKANLLRNSTVSWKQLLYHHMKTVSWEMSIDSQKCCTDNFNTVLTDFDFIQHVSTPTHMQGHILDILCTNKFLTSSVHHYVKDSISDHLAVFFITTFPVKNSCRVKHLNIRNLGKINKTEFMSDIANLPNSCLILQVLSLSGLLTKQPAHYHTSIFIPLGIYWTREHLYMNAKLRNMSTKGS